jgi:hypothetical protein
MNADERAPDQQSTGEQSPAQSQDRSQTTRQQHPQADQQGSISEPAQGGSVSTGQASYGNSGETGAGMPGQGLDQETNLGQMNPADQQSGNGLFSGSGNDMGSSSTANGSSDVEDTLNKADEQDFADQGQGALSDDAMASSQERGTTDLETERSQGRPTDTEGSSL